MAQVTLKINGYAHALACADGEEDHLRAMGAALDERIAAMKKAGVQGSEARMLLMAALMVSDELTDAKAEVARLNAEAAIAEAKAALPPEDDGTAEAVRRLASRIDGVASALLAPLTPTPVVATPAGNA
jgi:cell division protein ZapA